MYKLGGGNTLACGHTQIISQFRFAAYKAGLEQRPVWCVECNNWSQIIPAPIEEEPIVISEEAKERLDVIVEGGHKPLDIPPAGRKGLRVVPYEINPESERPTGGGDIPPSVDNSDN